MTTTQITRKDAENHLRKIFGTEDIFVVGQGFNINFALPLDTPVTENQIDALKEINYKLVQVEAVVNKSGFTDHLHIHVREVFCWEQTK